MSDSVSAADLIEQTKIANTDEELDDIESQAAGRSTVLSAIRDRREELHAGQGPQHPLEDNEGTSELHGTDEPQQEQAEQQQSGEPAGNASTGDDKYAERDREALQTQAQTEVIDDTGAPAPPVQGSLGENPGGSTEDVQPHQQLETSAQLDPPVGPYPDPPRGPYPDPVRKDPPEPEQVYAPRNVPGPTEPHDAEHVPPQEPIV